MALAVSIQEVAAEGNYPWKAVCDVGVDVVDDDEVAVEGDGCWFDDDPDICDDDNKDIETVDDLHSPEQYFFQR